MRKPLSIVQLMPYPLSLPTLPPFVFSHCRFTRGHRRKLNSIDWALTSLLHLFTLFA